MDKKSKEENSGKNYASKEEKYRKLELELISSEDNVSIVNDQMRFCM